MCTLRRIYHVGQRHEIARLEQIFIHVLFECAQDPILITTSIIAKRLFLVSRDCYRVSISSIDETVRFSSFQLYQLIFIHPSFYPEESRELDSRQTVKMSLAKRSYVT